MTHSGRCYCGKINYEFEEPIYTQILCHCIECRYMSGGEANASIVISENNFRVTVVTRNIHQKSYIIKTQPNVGYIDIVEANIFDEKKIRELFKKSDICVNLIGILFEKKKRKYI